jgi:hypothetical protein
MKFQYSENNDKLILSYYISNKMQRYTVHFTWKLLHMFRVVPPPIIRSAYNSIYSIWYLSHRYCYLPLAALHVSCGTSTHYQERIQLYLQHLVFVTLLLISAAIGADSSNDLTNTRCCRYSCLRF